MTSIVDWREADAADVVPLVTAEAKTWLQRLHWDVAEAWQVIEPARLAGQLRGAVAFDRSGRPVGWTAYLRHGTSLQVMALVAPHEEATLALLDAVLESEDALASETAIVCVRDVSPGLPSALAAHGFSVEPYRYLRAQIEGVAKHADDGDAWHASTVEVARLFQQAYAGEGTVRAFAPTGAFDEWLEYVAQLEKGPGCGWFRPDLSVSSRSVGGGGDLEAAILVTHLGPGTAHIAQLAVDPFARRRGLGRRLVTASLRRAAGRYDRATLLVSAANRAAGALYESLGFGEIARFVVATKPQPTRLTSLACSSGGASTRL